METTSKPFKRGKVKDVYELDDDQLVFVFTDRVSAYDVCLPSNDPRKGLNCVSCERYREYCCEDQEHG